MSVFRGLSSTIAEGFGPILNGCTRIVPAASPLFSDSSLVTLYVRMAAEAPFDAVRLFIWSIQNVQSSGYTAIVAGTETAAVDTTSNNYFPISGGVAFNSVVTTGPGWRAVTWNNGQATGGPLMGTGSIINPSLIASDWITCPSVPRADTDGAARPLLLLRIMQNGGTNGQRTAIQYGGSNSITRQELDYSREFEISTTASDGVGTLSTAPATSYVVTSAGVSIWFAVEFRYHNAVRSVLSIGDSIVAGNGSSTTSGLLDGWVAQAVRRVSTPDAPVVHFNGGATSQNSTTFFQEATDCIHSGMRPTILLVPSYTVNDGFPLTNSIVDAYFTKLDTFNALRNNLEPRPQLWLWKGLPENSYDVNSDAARLYSHSKADAYLTAGLVDKVIDINATVSDFATPQQFIPAYTSDGVHPSVAAGPVLGAPLRAALRSAYGPTLIRKTRIFGNVQVGGVLSAWVAQVSGSGALTRTYQWKSNGTNISGATSSTYTVVSGDLGNALSVVETISNSNGTITSTSASTSAVIAATTNLIPGSNSFGSYTLSGLTVTANNATDPFGGNAANLLTEDTNTNAHSFVQASTTSYTSAQTYTASIYVKQGTQRYFEIAMDSSRFGTTAYANFDLALATVTFTGATATARISYVYGFPGTGYTGWYRIEVTATATSTGAGSAIFKMSNGASNVRNATYLGASKTHWAYGAQIEKASPAGAYLGT